MWSQSRGFDTSVNVVPDYPSVERHEKPQFPKKKKIITPGSMRGNNERSVPGFFSSSSPREKTRRTSRLLKGSRLKFRVGIYSLNCRNLLLRHCYFVSA